MRRRQCLEPRVIIPPCLLRVEADEGLVFEVDVAVEGEEVSCSYRVSGRAGCPSYDFLEWYYEDHVVFFFDFFHDHMTESMIAVRRRGGTVTRVRSVLPCEEPMERRTGREDTLRAAFSAEVRDEGGTTWGGVLRVRLPEGHGPVVGIAAKAAWGGTPVRSAVVPAWGGEWPAETPLGYADLYVAGDTFRLLRLDFGSPGWGENRAGIFFEGGEETGYTVRSSFLFGGEDITRENRIVSSPAFFDYALDFRAKWSNDVDLTASLAIDISRGGEPAWKGSFPVAFDAGIIARDETGGPPVPLPRPEDDRFAYRMREYFLRRLPRFERVATRDGAPSDFCLVAGDSGRVIDLAREDGYDALAEIVAERFDTWEHGFAAAAVFLGSAAGIRHSAQNAALAASLHPRGILQLGAAFCGQQAECFCYFAEKLAARYGIRMEAYTIGLRGHIAAAVRVEGRFFVFDPMLGLFFYTLENTRLATLDEMRRVREISHRMDAYCRAHGHEFYYGIPYHVIRPPRYAGRVLP